MAKDYLMVAATARSVLMALWLAPHAHAFGIALPTTSTSLSTTITTTTMTEWIPLMAHPSRALVKSSTALEASVGKKKRRRRRKELSDPITEASLEQANELDDDDDDDDYDIDNEDDGAEMIFEKEKLRIGKESIAAFGFQPPKADDAIPAIPPPPSPPSNSDSLPLPDIRDQLKRKELQQKIAEMEAQEEAKKVKIKRSDKEAFTKLLEQQPFSDADDSLFEEEAYGTVSALLGERAKPFLGIPTGPLQVGHFIGALGIILMAFVEYPGFPLTNLPTPIRDALAGGLGTVYAINTVLAILSIFAAQERGQPAPFWMLKTFTVGGLAYDQLTQLPTTAQVERANSIKGARAPKNRKR